KVLEAGRQTSRKRHYHDPKPLTRHDELCSPAGSHPVPLQARQLHRHQDRTPSSIQRQRAILRPPQRTRSNELGESRFVPPRLPHDDWEDLLAEMKLGSIDSASLKILEARMEGNKHSIVRNFPDILMVKEFGTKEQKQEFIGGRLSSIRSFTFGLTEPGHGSDATHMSTYAEKSKKNGVDGWVVNGAKMWISGMHRATHCLAFARTHGKAGDAIGITAFFVPRGAPGFKIESYEWTFNMPTDHASLTFTDVFVPDSAVLGRVGCGLPIAQTFVHENRLRQAASSLGAAEYCVGESVAYARERKPFGDVLSANQAVQFPLVELATQVEMLRLLILKTATEMDGMTQKEIERDLGDKVSMCNYWGNRLCTQAADRAIQVHGGIGYSRHKQFEHIYRHHRRYRITEGSEEIQMRKVAAYLFRYVGPRKAELTKL
ncbi:Butyryl-CoA dehydrogenase, partial [Lachnellula arida]